MKSWAILCCLFVVVIQAGAQGQTDDSIVPRMPNGRPDLQGIWASDSATPLERPEEWAGKAILTDEELASLQAAAATAVGDGDALFGDQLVLAAIDGTKATSYDPTTGNYNQFWIVERDFINRTSLVVDPPDGRIPDVTPEAQRRRQRAAAYRRAHPADTYTDRPLQERCVTYGVPRLGAGYNSYYQVFQSAQYVVILNEMIHDARVIPLTGQPHLVDGVGQLHGDSRGHWEGDTLVIETVNLTDKTRWRGSSETMALVERLTRQDNDTLVYEFTVTDPDTWTQPWSAEIPMRRGEEPIYEYACHEGNYSMEAMLGGARADERAEGGQ